MRHHLTPKAPAIVLSSGPVYFREAKDTDPPFVPNRPVGFSTQEEQMGKTTYKSDIVLGQEYEHTRTGLKGHATAIYFFENACERVCLQYLNEGKILESTFDSVELKHVETQKPAESPRTGGPRGPQSSADAR